MIAILYALGCLVSTALNDFVFKLSSNIKINSRGMFVSLVGIVWMLTTVFLPMNWHDHLGVTVASGLVTGFVSIVANLLLLEAMDRQSAGVCSTIFRLNLVGVVLISYFFLGESLGILQVVGIVFAVAAVLLFMPRVEKNQAGRSARLGLILVIIASLIRAGMTISIKMGVDNGGDKNAINLLTCFFWVFGGLLYALWKERRISWPDRGTVCLGLISGVLVGAILYFMIAMNKYGKASVVTPIAQMSFLGTLLLSVVFLKEKIDRRKGIGLLFGMVALLCLCLK
ncbi:MAG: DMT family transporter [Victivallales bacterium]|nr:DMT family transporter [Victivallales bacterium]